MYRAGQHAPRQPAWTWPALAAVAGALVGAAVVFPLAWLAIPPRERVVMVREPDVRPAPLPEAPDDPPEGHADPPGEVTPAPSLAPAKQKVSGLALYFPVPRGGYIGLRDQVIRFGPDSLPSLPAGAAAPGNPPMTLQRMYESLADEQSEPASQ
jgi:hypothetical protein